MQDLTLKVETNKKIIFWRFKKSFWKLLKLEIFIRKLSWESQLSSKSIFVFNQKNLQFLPDSFESFWTFEK